MTQTITALFDERQNAAEALRGLLAAGFAREAIVVMPEEGGPALEGDVAGAGSIGGGRRREDDHGLWAGLKALFTSEAERGAYAEGLRRGGFTVSVRVEDERADLAIDAMEACGAVDFAERQVAWRAEGWDAEGWSAPPRAARRTGSARSAPGAPGGEDRHDGASDLADGDTGYATGGPGGRG